MEGNSAFQGIHQEINQYYSAKINRYGATPLGVDWTCTPTQELRFIQLFRLMRLKRKFSLNDIGCGYGALVEFISKNHKRKKIDYLGIDLSKDMIREAREYNKKFLNGEFFIGSTSPRTADYSVASGIFNVKLHQTTEDWHDFIEITLEDIYKTSRRGFSINFLKTYQQSPAIEELYRTDPKIWMDFCTNNLGCHVELLDNYGLSEFTLLIHKN